MEPMAARHFEFMNKTFGKYPYETYSIIQGGDGGMEYPMCTLILGEGSFGGLVGLMAHEVSHSWYQGVLASNESMYPWLDEGFTDFAGHESEAALFGGDVADAHAGSYANYFSLIRRGLQEPASQHADHYSTNTAYTTTSYAMGAIFLHQLKYVIGEETFYKGMRGYYNTWKFRHPEPIDFIRVMEKTSGLQLKWYLSYSINSTKRIDYGIKTVIENEGTFVTLEKIGEFPMPVDLMVTYTDGKKELFYVPLNETLGKKQIEDKSITRTDLPAWRWVNPTYTLKINRRSSEIASIEIDPSMRLADIDRKNNKADLSQGLKAYQDTTR
jgi:hypothetical protein